MSTRFLILLLAVNTAMTGASLAQPPAAYLNSHHYVFSPAEGFNGPLADTLARKLSAYRLILQAEGGSHGLSLYVPLELAWLKFVNQRLGVTCFLGERGNTSPRLSSPFVSS
jgi:hypothetical protein